MQVFIKGQRWVSDTESELGLGIITGINGRNIQIQFTGSGEQRVYASHNAPLTRVAFNVGEKISTSDGRLLFIEQVLEQDGLLSYIGRDDSDVTCRISEEELNPKQVFSRPQERLLRGQLDNPKWFDLRYQTLQHAQRLAASDTFGLTGIRAELLPHQLYIAHEVATRNNPRVLLADEVGLGKTIEAGMIIHRQILTGRASRVLILVPEPLLHQWLVELLRRFNLSFRIFDEERCQAIEENNPDSNPFFTEQLVLTSLQLFLNNPTRHSQALNAEWDLLVVDEAHHLEWTEQTASNEYLAVEQIATSTPGVLLLTATPEQLGKSGHFARLRLLDPDRFHDLPSFEKEEAGFAPIASAVDCLLDDDADHHSIHGMLTRLHDDEVLQLALSLENHARGSDVYEKIRDQLINELIDRHGTGRVLFRNTRSRIKGFPTRQLHTYPLTVPEVYRIEADSEKNPASYLQPENHYRKTQNRQQPDWWEFDPRIGWLADRIRSLAGKKILLICASAQTAIDLENCLRTSEGILSAVFHEQMSIVERDRAAAWFADPEEGTPLLICSEIGSEGRNFQFSHHLVLFDLPLNPDLLEQRIGRLDRIGQQYTIELHVPYFENSASETMVRWYQQGLNAFERTCPEGHTVFQQLEPALRQALKDPDEDQLKILLETASQLAQQTREQLEHGRDHLLELSSCRQPQANELTEKVASAEHSPELVRYLEKLSDCYGLEFEDHSPGSFVMRPTAQMSTDHFPHVPEEGLTLTVNRKVALAREDRHFVSWEHPLTRSAMDMVISGTHGRTGLIAAKTGKGSGLLLECLYVLETVGPAALQAGKFLPPTMIRLLLNSRGENQAAELSFESLQDNHIPLEAKIRNTLLDKARPAVPALLEKAEAQARQLAKPLQQRATEQMLDFYTNEIQRLTQLQTINPLVRDDEIEDLQAEGLALHRMLDSAQLRLDAVRIVVLA